jgi:NAD(P)-dependent dehydrogenase (short-subunit alcohol dehydrogenase family)
MGSMDGKIAIVTGSTQGLGAAVASLFAERGAAGIVICGRSEAKGRAKVDEIKKARATKVIFVPADLTNVEDCARIVAECDRMFGRVDALVNAAGDTSRGTIIDTDPALYEKIFAINARAPFFLMQHAIKLMCRDHVQGTIVNISSMSAMGGQPLSQPIAHPKARSIRSLATQLTRCCAIAFASMGSTLAGWPPRASSNCSENITADLTIGWKTPRLNNHSVVCWTPRKLLAPWRSCPATSPE